MEEVSRIVDEAVGICESCRSSGAEIRLFGSVAVAIVGREWFKKHPGYARTPRDIDLVGPRRDLARVRDALRARGYQEAAKVAMETEGQRALFGLQDLSVDFSGDELVFCQRLGLLDRLLLSYPTLPLTDLLLEKLQIVKPTRNQLVDFLALASTLPSQDVDRLRWAQILGQHWGYWHSAFLLLEQARNLAAQEGLEDCRAGLALLSNELGRTPRRFAWHLRSWFGTALPWHATVEDLRAYERWASEPRRKGFR